MPIDVLGDNIIDKIMCDLSDSNLWPVYILKVNVTLLAWFNSTRPVDSY
jgi:hypothetical protein